MSKNNVYLNGAVHLDHSHSLEINQQNLSAEELSRIIHAFMHGDAPRHTESTASSPMPVYAEEVMPETEAQAEAQATSAEARQKAEAWQNAEIRQEASAQAQAAQMQTEAAAQAEAALSLAEWLKGLIHDLRQEGLLKRQYDYTWVMWGVNYAAGRRLFASARSFLDYLTDCGIDRLPSIASLQAHNQCFSLSDRPDQWSFRDTQDERERQRRIRVGKYTVHSFQANGLSDR